MREQTTIRRSKDSSEAPDSKRRVDKISDYRKYAPGLKAKLPRMLKAYGSIEKLAEQLKIGRPAALNLVLLALVDERESIKKAA